MKVYGIFSGQYSDWDVHGYFTDEELAEKYCALKNRGLVDDEFSSCYDSYYVVELDNIQDNTNGLKDIELKYYHEVLIDYKNYGNDGTVRDEPNRYTSYCGEDKPIKIRTYFSGWISFSVTSNSTDRTKAEKIAIDMFNEFKWLLEDLNADEKLALKVLANKKKCKLEIH